MFAFLHRWAGLAGVAGGLLLLALAGLTVAGGGGLEDYAIADVAPLYAVFLAAATIGLPGWKQCDRLTFVGWGVALLGAVGMAAGLGLMVWFNHDSGWSIWFVSGLAHPFGLLLYGIAALKRRLLNRWSALPLVVGLAAGPAAVVLSIAVEMAARSTSNSTDPAFILWAVALGAGWASIAASRMRSGSDPVRQSVEA